MKAHEHLVTSFPHSDLLLTVLGNICSGLPKGSLLPVAGFGSDITALSALPATPGSSSGCVMDQTEWTPFTIFPFWRSLRLYRGRYRPLKGRNVSETLSPTSSRTTQDQLQTSWEARKGQVKNSVFNVSGMTCQHHAMIHCAPFLKQKGHRDWCNLL